MERRAMLRPLRKPQDEYGPERQADAVLVFGLPLLLLRSDRHGDGVLQASDPEMGYRHLPVPHSLKSVSSMKLHRDIGISQRAAWFMLHRIREAWEPNDGTPFSGPVEVDESYFGGKRRNMSLSKRKGLTGRGAKDKTAVVAVKDRGSKQVRAKVVENTDQPTLQGFVLENVAPTAKVYTDDASAYNGLPRDREAVRHSVSEYVRGMAHINGVESFWSMLKRAHKGTFHKLSPKHLQRYVNEFAAKNNIRDLGTLDQMLDTVARMVGHRLLYRDLIASNGLSSTSRE